MKLAKMQTVMNGWVSQHYRGMTYSYYPRKLSAHRD
jgi:hypothetical protein